MSLAANIINLMVWEENLFYGITCTPTKFDQHCPCLTKSPVQPYVPPPCWSLNQRNLRFIRTPCNTNVDIKFSAHDAFLCSVSFILSRIVNFNFVFQMDDHQSRINHRFILDWWSSIWKTKLKLTILDNIKETEHIKERLCFSSRGHIFRRILICEQRIEDGYVGVTGIRMN
jgi:hypothetical protein